MNQRSVQDSVELIQISEPFVPPQTTQSECSRNGSIRHKLVSLTLKKKSKITEEVRRISHVSRWTVAERRTALLTCDGRIAAYRR